MWRLRYVIALSARRASEAEQSEESARRIWGFRKGISDSEKLAGFIGDGH